MTVWQVYRGEEHYVLLSQLRRVWCVLGCLHRGTLRVDIHAHWQRILSNSVGSVPRA
jgi:hypothetical protein